MNLLPPYHIFRDFLSDGDRCELLDFALANEPRFVPTTVFRGPEAIVDPERRISSKIADLGAVQDRLRGALQEVGPAMFERIGMRPFAIGDIELELVAHNDGAHFAAHRDTLVGASRQQRANGAPADRMVSGVYYFFAEPQGFSGGELRLHPFVPGGTKAEAADIPPVQNSLILFPSFAPHEVLRVCCPSRRFADSRFAVNCWFYKAV